MPKRRELLVAAAIIILFLITNRAAYQGYFSGDDLDNLKWTANAGSAVFVRGLMTLQFNPDNFRPVGHAFFRLLGATAELRFAPYLAVLQALHLGVALLIYLLARSFGASRVAAGIGSLFFVFHMALFGAFWKPMYVFDVLCAFFCCLSLLAWKRSGALWWIVSFLSFWFAYKSKEVAVMLPAVLILVEFVTAEKRWLRVLPFLGVSLMFGVQAVLYSLMGSFNHTAGPYQLRLTSETLLSTVAFYGEHLFLSPWGLILLAAILFFARSRWGAAAALLFLVPMLVLPGRTFAVYLYVPMVFVALLVSSAAERAPKLAVLLLIPWLGVNFLEMRRLRSEELAEASHARTYVETLMTYRTELEASKGTFFDGYPRSLQQWGVAAAVDLVLRSTKPPSKSFVTLSWQPGEGRLYLFRGLAGVLTGPPSHLDMSTGTFLLSDSGWYEPEAQFRWTAPLAKLALSKPGTATVLECRVLVPEEELNAAQGAIHVEILLDGRSAIRSKLERPGWQTIQTSAIPGGSRKSVAIEIRVTPAFRAGTRELGLAVGAIGFR